MTPSLGQPRLTIPKSKQINTPGFLNLKFYEPVAELTQLSLQTVFPSQIPFCTDLSL